jgi:uncharacterized protein YjbI with pentapeptide repeats
VFAVADERALKLVQEENHIAFNQLAEALAAQGKGPDLSGAHLRSYDLRKFNLKKANLTNAYMRVADLRGQDLSEAILEGASICDANISGALFPRNLSATEIQMSHRCGARMRQGI